MATTMDDDELMLDLDMEIDAEPMMEEEEQEQDLEEGEEPENIPSTSENKVIPAIYTEDPLDEPQQDKVYVFGIDDFSPDDINAYPQEHFPTNDPPRVQWIDDHSANFWFKSSEIAAQALLAFTAVPTSADDIRNNPFELRAAKPLSLRPASVLRVRVAKAGDRKKKGARHESRYYLMHPEVDPGEYKRKRFDAHEHQRRRDHDHNVENTEYTASMYDDAPATDGVISIRDRSRGLESRISRRRGRRRSASPGKSTNSDEIQISDSEDDRRPKRNGYRDRSDRLPRRDRDLITKENTGKELFASNGSNKFSSRQEGTLHSDKIDLFPSKTTKGMNGVRPSNAVAAAQRKTQLLASPQHRRSKAMDGKIEEDLLERFARKSLSMDSTKGGNIGKELFGPPVEKEMSIKGSAAMNQGMSIKGTGGMQIKGRAVDTKELFPEQYKKGGQNEGKELFDQPVRGRGRRARAVDWD